MLCKEAYNQMVLPVKGGKVSTYLPYILANLQGLHLHSDKKFIHLRQKQDHIKITVDQTWLRLSATPGKGSYCGM